VNSVKALVWHEFGDAFQAYCVDYFDEFVVNTFSTFEQCRQALENGGFDLVILPNFYLDNAIAGKLLGQIRTTSLSNAQELKNLLFLGDDEREEVYSIPYFVECYGIGYNARTLSKYPESWMDFFSSEKRLQVQLLTEMRVSMAAALLALGHSPNSANEKHIEEAGELLISALPFTIVDEVDLTMRKKLVKEEVDLCLVKNTIFADIDQQGIDLRFILPQEPTILEVLHLAIPANSPSPEASMAIVDYFLDPRMAAQIAVETQHAVLLRAAKKYVDRRVLNGPPYFLPQADMLVLLASLDRETEEKYEKTWNHFLQQLGSEVETAILDSDGVNH
jgi:spermidine/putrescine-binding protein